MKAPNDHKARWLLPEKAAICDAQTDSDLVLSTIIMGALV